MKLLPADPNEIICPKCGTAGPHQYLYIMPDFDGRKDAERGAVKVTCWRCSFEQLFAPRDSK